MLLYAGKGKEGKDQWGDSQWGKGQWSGYWSNWPPTQPYYKPSKGAKGKDGKGKGKGKVGKDSAQWKDWSKGDSADALEQEKESLKGKLRAMQEEYNAVKKKADGAYYAGDTRHPNR